MQGRGFRSAEADHLYYRRSYRRVYCIFEKFGDEVCGSFESDRLANGSLLCGWHRRGCDRGIANQPVVVVCRAGTGTRQTRPHAKRVTHVSKTLQCATLFTILMHDM
jgi:hypothetical protein